MSNQPLASVWQGIFQRNVRRGGVPLAPHDVFNHFYSNTALPAGNSIVNLYTVPTGVLRVITNILFISVGTAPTQADVQIFRDPDIFAIFGKKQPVTQEYNVHACQVLAIASDIVRLSLVGATLNADIYVHQCGYDINLRE